MEKLHVDDKVKAIMPRQDLPKQLKSNQGGGDL